VNDFVEQCRREWKRLGVRGAVADEMAAELTADLEEGASPEEVLGSDGWNAAQPRTRTRTWRRVMTRLLRDEPAESQPRLTSG
jgi:hypothetical protein